VLELSELPWLLPELPEPGKAGVLEPSDLPWVLPEPELSEVPVRPGRNVAADTLSMREVTRRSMWVNCILKADLAT